MGVYWGRFVPALRSGPTPIMEGTLVVEITVSGRVPDVPMAGSTTGTKTYFVVDKDKSAIVGSITLPSSSKPHGAFRITVRVPSASENFDVGVFDDAGGFVSSGFTLEVPKPPSGAVGPRG